MAGQCDFLFCDLCGTMLNLGAVYANCPLCPFKRPIKECVGKQITYSKSGRDIRRELGLSPSQDDENYEQRLMFKNYKQWKLICTQKAGGLKETLKNVDKGKKKQYFGSQSSEKELHFLESKMKGITIGNDNVVNEDHDDIRARLIMEMKEVIRIRLISEDDWDTVQEMIQDFKHYRPTLAVFSDLIGETTWTEIEEFALEVGCPFVDARPPLEPSQPRRASPDPYPYDIGHYMQNIH